MLATAGFEELNRVDCVVFSLDLQGKPGFCQIFFPHFSCAFYFLTALAASIPMCAWSDGTDPRA